jgi:hypothetical protein
MALQLKRVSCWVTMVPYCERRTDVARRCMDSICLILGKGFGEWADKTNSQNRRVDSAGLPNVIALAECGDDSAGRDAEVSRFKF